MSTYNYIIVNNRKEPDEIIKKARKKVKKKV